MALYHHRMQREREALTHQRREAFRRTGTPVSQGICPGCLATSTNGDEESDEE